MTENKGNTNQTSLFGNTQNDPSKQSSSNLFSNNAFSTQKNEDKKESIFQNNSNTNKPGENEPKSAFGSSTFFNNSNKDSSNNPFATGKSMFGNVPDKSVEQQNPNIPENTLNKNTNTSNLNFFQTNNAEVKKDNNPSSVFSQPQQNMFSGNTGKPQSDQANSSFGGIKNETNNQSNFPSSKDKATSLFGNTGFGQSSSIGQTGGSSLFGGSKEETKQAQGNLFSSGFENKQNEVKKEESKPLFGSNTNTNVTNDNKTNNLSNNNTQKSNNINLGNQSNPQVNSSQSAGQITNTLFSGQSNSNNLVSGQPAQNTENKQATSFPFVQADNKQGSLFSSAPSTNTENKQQSSFVGGNTNVNLGFGSTGPGNTDNKPLFGNLQPSVSENKAQPQQPSSLFSGGSSSLFGQNTGGNKQTLNFATNTAEVKKEEKKETNFLFSSNNQQTSVPENKSNVNFTQPSIPETKSTTNLFQPLATETKSTTGFLQPSSNEPKPSSGLFGTFGGQQEIKIQPNLAPEKKDQTDKKDVVENKQQTLFSGNFGGGDKKTESKDQSSTISFGLNQPKKEISFGATENKLTNENKNITFGGLTSTKTEDNKLTDLKDKKDGRTAETVSFSQNLPPQLKDLDKAGVDNLMKKSIEEVINRWKKEMDKQTSKFTDNGERLKHFEQIFNKNFENLMEVSENINQIEAQSKNTLNDLKELNNQEDIIIDQLSLMEKHLDTYLNVFEKKTYPDNNNPRDYIYQAADEISNMVDNIETGINEVKDRLYNLGSENTKEIQFNLNEKEDLNFDANEFNSLLNNYYNALNGITYMEHNMKLKINEIENDLKIKREKEQSFKNTFNY